MTKDCLPVSVGWRLTGLSSTWKDCDSFARENGWVEFHFLDGRRMFYPSDVITWIEVAGERK
jgi:hypothetical protein